MPYSNTSAPITPTGTMVDSSRVDDGDNDSKDEHNDVGVSP